MNEVRDVWQTVYPAGTFAGEPSHRNLCPATFDDGCQILLPIRSLADGHHALASLIINQASFAVRDRLADSLAQELAAFKPEVVVGLPTLGPDTCRRGGTSVASQSRSSSRDLPQVLVPGRPFGANLVRDDARRGQTPLCRSAHAGRAAGRRVALVDDVISSGTSILAALRLMAIIGIEPDAIGTAMLLSERWHEPLTGYGPHWLDRVRDVFRTPLLKQNGDGWG